LSGRERAPAWPAPTSFLFHLVLGELYLVVVLALKPSKVFERLRIETQQFIHDDPP
jgi:hypothetical protein